MNEVVYTSENRLRKTEALLQEKIDDLQRSRSIALGIMIRNIRAQYRQLFLGRLWALLPGLAAAFAVVKIRSAGILHIGQTSIPYPAYVIFGVMLWQSFTDALQGPIQGVMGDRNLIRLQNVPPESVVLAKQAEIILNFLVKLVFILIMLVWFGVKIQWTVLFLPFAFLILVVIATAIGLALAPLNLLYQDVSKGLTFLSTVWLFLTPVIYPRPAKGAFAILVNMNPVTPIIVTIRDLAVSPELTHLRAFAIVSALSVLALIFCWLIFRVTLPIAIERLNH